MESQNNKNSWETDLWSLYLYALKSPASREKYQKRLEKYFDFLGMEGLTVEEKSESFVRKLEASGNEWIFNSVLKFIHIQVERVNRKEISGATVRNYLKSIKLYCEMADIPINWKKIARGLPRGKSYADDRIPTLDEMQRILQYPDRRIKAIIFTMSSSGIRLGAWDYLKWGHIRPIPDESGNREVKAAKIIVYSGEDEEYFSFISKEAYLELREWMLYRENSGEIINEDSWLMRDLWDTRVAVGRGFVTKPKKLAATGIKRLIERAIWAQGLRKRLENGRKRHPFQAIHCFRKWFKTRCEIAGMKPINIEILLSHSVGISSSYYRPTEADLLADYVKVSDLLTFDKQERMQKELQSYQEKSQEDMHLIKGKLQERDNELYELKLKDNLKDDVIANISDQLLALTTRLRNLEQKVT